MGPHTIGDERYCQQKHHYPCDNHQYLIFLVIRLFWNHYLYLRNWKLVVNAVKIQLKNRKTDGPIVMRWLCSIAEVEVDDGSVCPVHSRQVWPVATQIQLVKGFQWGQPLVLDDSLGYAAAHLRNTRLQNHKSD